MSHDGTVRRYNRAESELAGLEATGVVDTNFFVEVAPCMNNFMVAQKMLDEPEVDETLPYVLTLRMRPTPVTLRLLKRQDVDTMYILVQRTSA